MSIVAGIDVGSRMTKGVLLNHHEEILARTTAPTGVDLSRASEKVFDSLLAEAGVGRKDVFYAASTGYGRFQAKMRDIPITEMTCHARGALEHFPRARSVIDIGAQSSRAMRVEGNGRVKAFRMNDKCAAGAGRFIERVARSLDITLEDVGPRSLKADDPQAISSVCAVLAESEVINHVTEGRSVENILAGAHRSIAERVVGLLKQIGVEEEVVLTGGMAKNAGMVRALETVLGVPLRVHPQAEYAGALGAAHWALVRSQKRAA